MITSAEHASDLQLAHILGRYGALIVERQGSDMDQEMDNLARWRHNIHLIHQLISPSHH